MESHLRRLTQKMQLDVGNEPTCHSDSPYSSCLTPLLIRPLFAPKAVQFSRFHLQFNRIELSLSLHSMLFKTVFHIVKINTTCTVAVHLGVKDG